MLRFRVHKLVPSRPVPHRVCTTILLIFMIMCSLFSGTHAACKCSSSDQDPRDRYTSSISLAGMVADDLYPTGVSKNTSGLLHIVSFDPVSNISASGYSLLLPQQPINLWEKSNDGRNLHEASFNVSLTMNIYKPQNQTKVESNLAVAIMPLSIIPRSAPPKDVSLGNNRLRKADINGCTFSVEISLVENMISTFRSSFNQTGLLPYNDTIRIGISIEPHENFDVTKNYSVWIDYDRDGQHLSVYIDAGISKPDSPIVTVPRGISEIMTPYASFGIFSSMDQLLQLHTWNSTVEKLPSISDSQGKWSAIIIASVAGSSAVLAAVLAASVYCYFQSKYRRWKKDFDQLAKSMQRLPGVPIQVSFSDIQKATNNFHETMKLGQGGFGSVYRCRLPSHVKGGEVLEVAVKKFTRDDNRRYEDFLAEVSVINRLRHKNIVPLIGWSYHKGEPLLIYDYMPNGSLDQHLFHRNIDHAQAQQQTPICQWHTRYDIVKDVAVGLQYVHHEHEPMVLHRDIKANNIMIDSTFHGCLGDFGLACVVAEGKNSYTDLGAPGTLGFRAHEYIHSGKATRKTDIFAFGVLILEIVTGKPAISRDVEFGHITDWVWHLHKEGRLLDAVDMVLTTTGQFDADEAKRLLLLGLACSNPNPSDRPSMIDVVLVINKMATPPCVPHEKPIFVWPPPGECPSLSSSYTTTISNVDRSLISMVQMAARSGHAFSQNSGNSLYHRPIGGYSQEHLSVYHTADSSTKGTG